MKSVLETWRPVPGYEGLYDVSDLGAVRSHYGGKVKYLKCHKDKDGYVNIGLCKNGKGKIFFVHRLVWEAFNGTVPEGMQIDHIDGNKENNALSNLRVVTPRENVNNPATRVRHLAAIKKLTSSEEWRQKNREAMKRRSENQEWLQKNRETVRRVLGRPIVQLDAKTSEVIRCWECVRDAARELEISAGNISGCCHGKNKSAGGYRWRFA